jgi:hypothetical protein
VSSRIDELAQLPELEQGRRYGDLRPEFDKAVFSYFGLTDEERALVLETVEILMPSIRPRSFKSLDTPAQHPADVTDFHTYARALAQSLTTWRARTRGRGRFRVSIVANDPRRAGPAGIVRVAYAEEPTQAPTVNTDVSDELVLTTLAQLRGAGLRAIPSGDALTLIPDAHIWVDGSLYLVRPLAQRSWTVRQALRDAEHIVRSVQASTPAEVA